MITKYDDFTNEELKKSHLMIPLIAGALAYGGYNAIKNIDIDDKAKLNKTEILGKQQFKEYSLYAAGEEFDLTIMGDFIVSHHSYEETTGSDKDKHTETIEVTNLTMSHMVNYIWYKDKTFGKTYASVKMFPGSHLIKMSDLKVYEQTPTYTVYTDDDFFTSCPFKYIIVNKNHTKGEEFKLTDNNIGTFVCNRIDKNLYIFGVKSLGGGKMGGGGAGGTF